MLDTNVVVSAVLWGGQPGHLVSIAHSGQIELFSSIPLLEELDEVLSRKRFASRVGATGKLPSGLVVEYAQNVKLVRPASLGRIVSDADDDMVIGTAVAAHANLLVSGDKALLGIGAYNGVRIVSVAEAIRLIGEQLRSK